MIFDPVNILIVCICSSEVAPSIATLPPPPVAPQLNVSLAVKSTEPARRIDLSDYKLRNNG